jgi:uncharacterized protein
MSPPRAAEVILKLAARCNLRCTYCYMYELEEQEAWRRQPLFTEPGTLAAAAHEIAEHVRTHDLDRMSILLHGGEPLLAGAERITEVMTAIRSAVPPGCTVTYGMQTNATLLTEDLLRQFSRYPLGFGVSIDGDDAANRKRLFPALRESAAETRRGLELLRRPEFRHMYGGLLAVIDPSNDPETVYRALRAEEPAHMDFLFPLATWDNPPQPGTGEWLARVFDAWYLDKGAPDIRLFHILMSRILGRDVRAGFIGRPPDEKSVVIQPDGSAEGLDALRVIGGTEVFSTGMNIRTHSVDEILAHPLFTPPGPCAECRMCPLFYECGGGYYPNRWKSDGHGYDHVSVYCDDLMVLIRHIRMRLKGAGIALPQPERTFS